MNKEVVKTAKKFINQLKGKADFVSVEEYISSIGYSVIFFNSTIGDIEINRFGLQDKALHTPAFTYCSSARIIFIDNTLSAEEKFYLLLHEVGHIILGHIGNGKLHINNKYLLDIEADAFAYAVLNPVKSKKPLFAASLIVCLSIAGLFVLSPDTVNTTVAPQAATFAPDPIPQDNTTNISTSVFVTPSGTKYHRSDCRYTKDKNCTILTIQEARSKYSPCSVCKP